MVKNKSPTVSVKKTTMKSKKLIKKPEKFKTKSKPQKPKDYGGMTVDDFMGEDIENESGNESELSEDDLVSDEEKQKINLEGDDEESELSDVAEFDELKSHKESLQKLKDTDPDFYQFLEENDQKLLNFNVSDSEDDERADEDQVHKPKEELEIASDESDFEPEEATATDDRTITLKMLKTWQQKIKTDKTSGTIHCLTKAFHAALVRVSSSTEVHTEYKITGSAVFNAVIQICVLELGPALRKYLKLQSGSKQAPHKCKNFIKVRTALRGYFLDLLKILGGVTSANILNVLLKHLHNMIPFLLCYSSVTRKMIKRLINLWGTADESVRVVAFLCLLRITNSKQTSYLDSVLKYMYLIYVKNSKFMTTGSIAEVNFMRRSLAEMYALDVNVSYQHVFLYIRQLAIHLRTAVTVQKKENVQAVYNWQFVNSLHLWATLLTITVNKPQLQPLIYPLVQIAIGTIKLVPTTQFFPLRFHCTQILIDLSRDTNIFIPILPLLLEVLTVFDFNKKHKKVSMKPLQFTCLLRLSKSHMIENGFKDATIELLYGQLLEYLSNQSHTISFPDTSLFCVILLKQFVKKCSVANYTRKMKQILEKIEQNTQFIETERKKITFNICDLKQIEAFETTIKNKGTPITTFYENWRKLHNIKKNKQLTNNEALGDYAIPQIRKFSKSAQPKSDGPVVLFPSDSESDDDKDQAEEEVQRKPRLKRGSKKNKKAVHVADDMEVDDGAQDIVQDLKASDW